MQVPIRQAEGQGRAGDHPSSPEVTIVSPFVSNTRNKDKSYYEDRFMQHSRAADRQERDELVGVEPSCLPRFLEFEGDIWNASQIRHSEICRKCY